MTDFHAWHFATLAALVLIAWALPKRCQMDGVAAASLIFVAVFSPAAAIALCLNTLLVYLIVQYRQRQEGWVLAAAGYVMVQFVVIRYLQRFESGFIANLSFIGLAYSSCRYIHYVVEGFRGKIKADLRQLIHYQFFLPVVVAGPINRYPDFVRSLQRRRWDSADFSRALERIVYGYAKVAIIGHYLIAFKLQGKPESLDLAPWMTLWLESLLDWAYLYAQFSGWSDIAIGFALLMGIRIPENFNHPLKAKNLIEFWQRWHISLSSWCKDYIFTPVLSVTRNPLIAVIAAMVVMGVWHELSLYYLLWGVYHALGIAVCRLYQTHAPGLWQTARNRTRWNPTQHTNGGAYAVVIPADNSAITNKLIATSSIVLSWGLTFSFIISGAPIIETVNQWILTYV
ncbi:Peptidoglycan O-acetyltransferase [BD1-7 clade bacterium]|uniref:Probable alginate O-acetylase AlgI n=1 Tax=BD1-7 clade bacterium TaxID=2029982 RepID=A0A5S9PDJ6_9GAMM|nr:Peptidoglycan O-acetyltransferase [BD1-7 clade bacterium]CAA0102022.1 Peptidoglycan O-acetyltransferase [BD1-7 clade bacterium]